MVCQARSIYSFLLLIFGLFFSSWATADEASELVPQAWQMLDYLAVDYAEAVENGQIIDAGEYVEMQDFSAAVRAYLVRLPEHPQKQVLLEQAETIVVAVENKIDAAEVKRIAQLLADSLLLAYPIPTAPETTPDLVTASKHYQQHCAACHGARGNADGPLAAGLDPEAIAFTDLERADQRSPLSLFQTITQGVEDTSMVAYKDVLDEEARWALAYYVGAMGYIEAAEKGAQIWNENELWRAQVSSLEELSHLKVDQLESVFGEEKARELVGFLRMNPQVLEASLTGFALARGRLLASFQAYQNNDVKNAVKLALSSYLDGVEPVEPLLNTKDSRLRQQIELAMGVYRTGLNRGVDIAVLEEQRLEIDRLLVKAQELTAHSYDASTVFVGAFTILLREGLEALLIIVAIFTFLNKAGRAKEAAKYVHAGWVLALIAGGITWFIARHFIEISGASRELTEGISALFAALMLLAVGLWMHHKSVGDKWQAYIKAKVDQALTKKSIGFLFVLAFVSVYREVFETILFYAALWTDGLGHWLVAGMLTAILVLAVIAWLLVTTSQKLPISTFFAASSWLIAILAIVLTGKGISALQEAGWMHVSLVSFPSIDLLGIYPTWETLIGQLIMLIVLGLGYFYNRRSV